MKINKFKKFFGYKYIANHNSKEIHRIEDITKYCHISLMKNATQETRRKAIKLLHNGYDGCKHCYKDKHIN